MFKNKKLYDIYNYTKIVLIIISIVMKILDYYQIITDNYSNRVIFLVVSVDVFGMGVSTFKKKKVWGTFLIIISISTFLVSVLGLH